MKKIIALVVMLAGIMAVVTACGVAQEDLDSAVAERDTARAAITSLEAEVADLEAEHDINHELLETLEATDLGAVLLATAKYQDEAVALADGYVAVGPPPPASLCVQAPPGSMGIHYANFALMEEPLDLLKPLVLLYLPTASGVRLVGIEYFVVALANTDEGPAPWFDPEAEPTDGWFSSAPVILGKAFNGPMASHGDPSEPWHYDQHVWLWEENPTGMFEDFNPAISCPE